MPRLPRSTPRLPRSSRSARRALTALTLALALVPLASLAGCGGGDDDTDQTAPVGSAGAAGSAGAGGATAGTGGGAGKGGAGGAGMGGGAGAGGAGMGGGAGGGNAGAGGAGKGGSGGTAGAGGAGKGGAGNGGGGSPPVPAVCGDGFRDPVLEECDDGAKGTTDACSDACVVEDMLACAECGPSTGPLLRRELGGHHAIAVTEAGSAVLFTQRGKGDPAIFLRMLGPKGEPGALVTAYASPKLSDTTEPVVTALPDGAFAVAWTDLGFDADLRGVVARVVKPGAPDTAPVVLNQTSMGNQENPDLLWTGKSLVAVWTDHSSTAVDGIRVKMRELSASLTGGSEKTVGLDEASDFASLSMLSADAWGVAYRGKDATGERVRVIVGDKAWATAPYPGGGPYHPSLATLGSAYVVAYATLFNQDAAVRVALFDPSAPGAPLDDRALPGGVPTRNPQLATAGGRTYLAWETGGIVGGDAGDVFVSELTAAGNKLALGPSVLLPRKKAHVIGQQDRPRIAGAPLAFDGALITGWDDRGQNFGGGLLSEAVLQFLPVPIVRPMNMTFSDEAATW